MFIVEIDTYRVEFNITKWYFSWSYGIAWGAAIFLFGSAILLAIGKETASIEYREKPKQYRHNWYHCVQSECAKCNHICN